MGHQFPVGHPGQPARDPQRHLPRRFVAGVIIRREVAVGPIGFIQHVGAVGRVVPANLHRTASGLRAGRCSVHVVLDQHCDRVTTPQRPCWVDRQFGVGLGECRGFAVDLDPLDRRPVVVQTECVQIAGRLQLDGHRGTQLVVGGIEAEVQIVGLHVDARVAEVGEQHVVGTSGARLGGPGPCRRGLIGDRLLVVCVRRLSRRLVGRDRVDHGIVSGDVGQHRASGGGLASHCRRAAHQQRRAHQEGRMASSHGDVP